MPEEIPSSTADVSAGSRHTFIVHTDGKVFVTGFVESALGYYGHMGLGPVKTEEECEDSETEFCVESAGMMGLIQITQVVNAEGEKVDAPIFKRAFGGVGTPADTGGMHSVLISEDGVVYITGNNNLHQLCLGEEFDNVDFVDYFHEVPGISDVETASIGDQFTLLKTVEEQVYGCGTNQVGQIGQDNAEFSNVPALIPGLPRIVDMATGLRFSIFLDVKGKVWATGSNIYGQQCFYTEGTPTRTVTKVRSMCFPVSASTW